MSTSFYSPITNNYYNIPVIQINSGTIIPAPINLYQTPTGWRFNPNELSEVMRFYQEHQAFSGQYQVPIIILYHINATIPGNLVPGYVNPFITDVVFTSASSDVLVIQPNLTAKQTLKYVILNMSHFGVGNIVPHIIVENVQCQPFQIKVYYFVTLPNGNWNIQELATGNTIFQNINSLYLLQFVDSLEFVQRINTIFDNPVGYNYYRRVINCKEELKEAEEYEEKLRKRLFASQKAPPQPITPQSVSPYKPRRTRTIGSME